MEGDKNIIRRKKNRWKRKGTAGILDELGYLKMDANYSEKREVVSNLLEAVMDWQELMSDN